MSNGSSKKWLSPLKVAQNVASCYEGNWVFLYSALDNHKNNQQRSYIALFEEQNFEGDNFEDFANIISNDRDQSMWFGGLCYELCDYFENYPKTASTIIKFPPIFFSKYAVVIEFDHHHQKINILNHKNYDIEKFFQKNTQFDQSAIALKIKDLLSNFTDDSYLQAINDIKNHIANGDFFLANLTRKFYGNFTKELNQLQNFQLFKELTQLSPASYSSFINYKQKYIISSSPELFLQAENNIIYSRPIKGTIRRGNNHQEDIANKKYLKNSSKERAENLMIVDLMRNDFAQFCQPLSVKVAKLFTVDSYKMIHHLSSQIEGVIDKNRGVFTALKSCFPAGSMTGAPKIKVIATLKNYENIERGIYSGAIGMVAKDKLNLAVVIRTLITHGPQFEFQVGGGITFDSNAAMELQEIYIKAQAILKILGKTIN